MIREDTKAGLGQTICTEDIQDIIKITEAEQDIRSNQRIGRYNNDNNRRGSYRNQSYGRNRSR